MTRRDKGKLSVVRSQWWRKYMTDREILEKFINLEKSCLTEKEKKEVMDMLCNYKKHLV